ncbi:MAG TPA: hypothetical protein VHZ51_05090, partial [Ktedonobacteraceae bacterium]|nr:hypothetical protein [Ktedonobacteraceae bacterium]
GFTCHPHWLCFPVYLFNGWSQCDRLEKSSAGAYTFFPNCSSPPGGKGAAQHLEPAEASPAPFSAGVADCLFRQFLSKYNIPSLTYDTGQSATVAFSSGGKCGNWRK